LAAPLTFNFAQDVLDRLASEDRVGLIYVDQYGHRRDYYFAEVAQLSQRYAGALQHLGVKSGDHVLFCTANDAKSLFALLALQRLGAVPVLCPEALDQAALRECVDDFGVQTIVAGRRRREPCERLRRPASTLLRYLLIGEEYAGWSRLDLLAERAIAVRGTPTQANDRACVLNGSAYDQSAIFNASPDSKNVLEALESDVVWCTLPMGDAAWFAHLYLAPWLCGAATVVHDAAFDPVERLDLIRELDVTILMQSPAEYAAEVQIAQIERLRAPRLHRCLSLGAPLDPHVASFWQHATHLPVLDVGTGVRLSR